MPAGDPPRSPRSRGGYLYNVYTLPIRRELRIAQESERDVQLAALARNSLRAAWVAWRAEWEQCTREHAEARLIDVDTEPNVSAQAVTEEHALRLSDIADREARLAVEEQLVKHLASDTAQLELQLNALHRNREAQHASDLAKRDSKMVINAERCAALQTELDRCRSELTDSRVRERMLDVGRQQLMEQHAKLQSKAYAFQTALIVVVSLAALWMLLLRPALGCTDLTPIEPSGMGGNADVTYATTANRPPPLLPPSLPPLPPPMHLLSTRLFSMLALAVMTTVLLCAWLARRIQFCQTHRVITPPNTPPQDARKYAEWRRRQRSESPMQSLQQGKENEADRIYADAPVTPPRDPHKYAEGRRGQRPESSMQSPQQGGESEADRMYREAVRAVFLRASPSRDAELV